MKRNTTMMMLIGFALLVPTLAGAQSRVPPIRSIGPRPASATRQISIGYQRYLARQAVKKTGATQVSVARTPHQVLPHYNIFKVIGTTGRRQSPRIYEVSVNKAKGMMYFRPPTPPRAAPRGLSRTQVFGSRTLPRLFSSGVR